MRVCNTCVRASNRCVNAHIIARARRRAPRALASPDEGPEQDDVRPARRARPLDVAHQGAAGARRLRLRAGGQGGLRGARALPARREPDRRRAAPARLPRAPRGRAGPAHEAHRHHRGRPRRRPPHRERAPGGPRAVHRLSHPRAAVPPHGRARRPPAPLMTRIRSAITDDNRRWWTLGAMCFALFMVMLDNTVVNVALPSIQKDLGSSISGLEWTVNAYTLA